MKIWITRNSASEIMFGGLERLFVWFRKPRFVMEYIQEKDRDNIFGYITEQERPLYKSNGWESTSSECWITNSVSFGKLFGYESEISLYVWEKLKKTFSK